MEKADFLDRVANGLARHGLSDSMIVKYTEQMSALLDELPPAELSAVLSGGIDIEAYITQLLEGEGSSPQAKTQPVTATAAARSTPAEKRNAAAETSVKTQPQKPLPRQDAENRAVNRERQKPQTASRGPAMQPAARATQGVSAPTEIIPKAPATGRLRNPAVKRRQDNRDYSRFWLFFWLTLPLTAAVVILVTALLCGLVALLVVLTVALIALLAAVAAAGTAVSLIGIIYGATQLFSAGPVGLYELGEGLIIGGAALFSGILIYNAAIRLNPYLIRKTFRLFSVAAKGLKLLFYRAKGALVQ